MFFSATNLFGCLQILKGYDNLKFSHKTSSTAFGGPPSPEGKASYEIMAAMYNLIPQKWAKIKVIKSLIAG
jgi:hypothetical protein